MGSAGPKPDGTQVIRRAAAMLREIARGPSTGMNLRDVSETMGLTRSTAHRILKCLLDERLIELVETERRYVIGGLTFELGLVATGRQRAILEWRPVVDQLSKQTGATVYLMGRSGNESVCLCKADGSSVVRVIPVEVGQRRPLGVGAGATALLAATADTDADRVLEAIAPYLQPYRALTLDQVQRNLADARRTGFAESHGFVVDGVYGLGMAIANKHGPATLALSLAAHQSLATEETIASWKRWMAKASQPAS